jgi:hypothetical protein
MAAYEFEANEVYGGVQPGKQAEIVDVVLTEDKDGDPVVALYVAVGSKLNNPKNPDDGGESIPSSEEMPRLYLGGLDDAGDDKKKQRRRISLDQLGRLVGEKLEDSEDTILRFAADHPHSLVPKLLGKGCWLKAVESGTKIYLNLNFVREKATPTSMAEMKDKLAKKRAAASPY